MALAQSKLTAQGQISVAAEVRRTLGLGTGADLEWDEKYGHIVVRRAGRFTSEDVHAAVFDADTTAVRPRTLAELKQRIQCAVRSAMRVVDRTVLAIAALAPSPACDSSDDCGPLDGRKVDEQRHCLGPETVVGCLEVGTGCGDEATFARSPEGECWLFPNTCIPDGWTALEVASDGGTPCSATGELCD